MQGVMSSIKLQQAVSALTSSVLWLPQYGCALVTLPTSPAALEPGKHSIHLVGLDSWAHGFHLRCGTSVPYLLHRWYHYPRFASIPASMLMLRNA